METKNWFNCIWRVERYITDNPDLIFPARVRLTCIESHNEVYPVGAVIDCAAKGLVD